MRLGVHRRRCSKAGLLPRRQLDVDGTRNGRGQLGLQRQHIARLALEGLAPEVPVGPGVDQLRSNPHSVARADHRSLHDGIHIQELRDLRRGRTIAPLELHRRPARRDPQLADRRQVAGQLIRHPLGEIVLRGVTRVVVERQHRNRTDGVAVPAPARPPAMSRHTTTTVRATRMIPAVHAIPFLARRGLRAPRGSWEGAVIATVVSASANSRAVVNRSLGALASARITAASTAAGDSVAQDAERGRDARSCSFGDDRLDRGPCHWRLSRRASHTSPRQVHRHRSARRAPDPRRPARGSCSSACPATSPVPVRRSPPASLTASAMPKSVRKAFPSWSRMFSGLMSR